ncbi:hypothetical protein [Nocardia carnea]|uniref:hypothetical protein n=1 Tax=Nocardia carnea TaxID=37328 RepID=UPI0024570045|nr:hypothetical protein [Nocardia carnea]
MPRFLLKAAPETDLYMFWSTVVSAPLYVGTRTETFDYLIQTEDFTPDTAQPAIETADRHGTTSRYTGSWNDSDGLILDEPAWLSRANFAPFMQALHSGIDANQYLVFFDA